MVEPRLFEAVGGRARVMVDGSICRGTDIVKAIALGADLVGFHTEEYAGDFLGGTLPGEMRGMGGGLALNQLLVTMDGVDNPPFLRKVFTNKINSILDAIYIVPRRVGSSFSRWMGMIGKI